jgi:hypothetical protein
MFALSATSMGSTNTGTFYKDDPGKLFPQRLFFDQVADANLTWKNYYNDTPWELFLEGIAHNPEHVQCVDHLDCNVAVWRNAIPVLEVAIPIHPRVVGVKPPAIAAHKMSLMFAVDPFEGPSK